MKLFSHPSEGHSGVITELYSIQVHYQEFWCIISLLLLLLGMSMMKMDFSVMITVVSQHGRCCDLYAGIASGLTRPTIMRARVHTQSAHAQNTTYIYTYIHEANS